jgi:mannose-6-phosphate isomerase-like protein (cupin superfamily)
VAVERKDRNKNAGLMFYAVVLLFILATRRGATFLQSEPDGVQWLELGIAAVSLGVAFFTSDAVGYVFNSIWMFVWNARAGRRPEHGGYSYEWRRLSYDLKQETLNRYRDCGGVQGMVNPWGQYSLDVFLSYFWQQAPVKLVEWVSRRHTVLHMARTVLMALASGAAVAVGLIMGLGLGWTVLNTVGLAALLLFAAFIEYNARGGRTEAWQMVNLWAAVGLDAPMGKTLRSLMHEFSASTAESTVSGQRAHHAEHQETAVLLPDFTVKRATDVKKRVSEHDERLYYFDRDVDIVVTNISKKHVAPAHLHTENTEIYYVVEGSLGVAVKGQTVQLGEGDLMIIYPGACHHFETAEEPVTFLAIKGKPGLDDKRPC